MHEMAELAKVLDMPQGDGQAQSDEHTEWDEYVCARTPENRNRLVLRYTEYARMHAAKLYADRQIQNIEFDEFRQYAIVGLLEAIDRFDPARGVPFRAYAGHRIRGAVLNGIEKYNEKQQQIALRTRLREERLRALSSEGDSCAEDPFLRLVDVAIGMAIGYMLEDSAMYLSNEETYRHNVYRSRELSDLVSVLTALVDNLPAQEKNVVRLHYFQQLRFEEIATQLALTKGRISQIHKRAMGRLRENYDDLLLFRLEF